ncbi:hypothetical protein OG563_06215 [Nocardia vinacea]|uniref:Uncharacterized protein n=1 Tax=Nocardia vinacea TaxID=96468 RepID=A0ABZ1YXS7_9NOCA|nr:hypothetical protein [Nocardia vinacea]
MINRLLILAMIPAWVWVILAVTTGLLGVIVILVLVVGGATSSIASDLHYQCDSAVGPDPALTETATPTATADSGARSGRSAALPSAMPTTNPYAQLTFAPEDTSVSEWQRTCVSALKSAPYQAAPLQTANTGFVAECAQKLALAQLGPSYETAAGSSGGLAADLAAMGRSVIYQASAASATGRCELPTAGGGNRLEAGSGTQGSATAGKPCGQLTAGAAVVELPNTLAGQASCGQRVDPAAVSAGDLVFWDYRNSAPTRSGIAVSRTEIITVDPVTGRTVEETMPTGRDVRVKRVLGGGL